MFYEIYVKFLVFKVMFKLVFKGKGIVVLGIVCVVVELVGYIDIYIKIYGFCLKVNIVRVIFKVL